MSRHALKIGYFGPFLTRCKGDILVSAVNP